MSNIPNLYYGHGEEIDTAVSVTLTQLSGEVPLEVHAIDEGIGAYEFWGAPGFDSRPSLEVTSDDFQININFPNCDFETAMKRVEEVAEYVARSQNASASFGHMELSGTFSLKLFDCALGVNVQHPDKLFNSALLTFVWEEQ